MLAVLAGRIVFSVALARAQSPFAPHRLLLSQAAMLLAALLLGACLWWVAQRQVGAGGASVALALYSTSPILSSLFLLPEKMPVSLAGSALGLFAMLYTAVGVAHALQGPRRKWGRRVTLMAALCLFTSSLSPLACAAGLVLALAAMLYLAEDRRRLLPWLFSCWIAASALPYLFARLPGGDLIQAWSLRLSPGFEPVRLQAHTGAGLWQDAGFGIAFCAALVLWAAVARSRYFGNTAPLTAALVLGGISWLFQAVAEDRTGAWAGSLGMVWALPFALLFIAGVFADGLETRARSLWIVLGAATVLLQLGQNLESALPR